MSGPLPRRTLTPLELATGRGPPLSRAAMAAARRSPVGQLQSPLAVDTSPPPPSRLVHSTGVTQVRHLGHRAKSHSLPGTPDDDDDDGSMAESARRVRSPHSQGGGSPITAAGTGTGTGAGAGAERKVVPMSAARTGAGAGAGARAGAGVAGSTASGRGQPGTKPLPRAASRMRWKRAIGKVLAVQALSNAHERWVAEHGDGGGSTSPARGKYNRNTRKAKRLEYTKEFGTAGGTIQKDKVLRRLNVSSKRLVGDGAPDRTPSPSLPAMIAGSGGAVGPAKRPSPLRKIVSSPPAAGGKGERRPRFPSAGSARDVQETVSQMELAMVATDAKAVRQRQKTQCGGKVWYLVEEAFTKPKGKAAGLCIFALVQVVLGAFLLAATSQDVDGNAQEEFTLMESVWESWTYVADPGTHADEASWVRRAMSFIITVSGIMLFAVVVGFVVDAIRSRLDELKRGKSSVVEKNHYLILGWTDKSFSLIRELCLAMESEGGGVIVVLSERDKEVLDAEISEQFSKAELCGTSVVCRTGSPLLVGDLNKVAASEARAIIILAEAGDVADKADAKVLRTVLGIMGLRTKIESHVVAELRDIDNEGLLQIIGKGLVETVVSHDVIGRLMLKCARQPGLADAYEMFLGFEGDEFYLKSWEALNNVRFGDLAFFFPDAIPVGIKRASGELLLNPASHVILKGEDELLVLAEDDDSYAPSFPPANVSFSPPPKDYVHPDRRPEKILFANSRRDVDDLIDLLDTLVVPGSELHLMSEVPIEERVRRMEDGGLMVEALENLTLVHHVGNPSFRRHLERLPLEEYTSVLVLADERLEHDSMHSDSSCLATLLLIRHIQESRLSETLATLEQTPGMVSHFSLLSADGGLTTPTAKTRSKILRANQDKKKGTTRAGSGKLATHSVRMRFGAEATAVSSFGSAASGGSGIHARTLSDATTGSSLRESAVVRARRARPQLVAHVEVEEEPDQDLAVLDMKEDVAGDSKAVPTSGSGSGSGAGDGSAPAHKPRARRRSFTDEIVAKYVVVEDDDEADESKRRGRRRSHRRSVEKEDMPGGASMHALAKPKKGARGVFADEAGRISPDAYDELSLSQVVDGSKLSLMACELLDIRTRNVVQENVAIAALSDYILSNAITSRVLAMIAERREVKQVLQELLGQDGQEVAVRSAAQYVRDGEELSFWEVTMRAQLFQQILLGYKAYNSETIVTNPVDKSEPRVWDKRDCVVVMVANADAL